MKFAPILIVVITSLFLFALAANNARIILAGRYLQEGKKSLVAGKNREAEYYLKKSAFLDPQNPISAAYLGHIYFGIAQPIRYTPSAYPILPEFSNSKKAVFFYELALRNGLILRDKELARDSMNKLALSYRAGGLYDAYQEMFLNLLQKFPANSI